MINGINLLEESGAVPRVGEIVRRFPESVQEILFAIVTGLFARQDRAHRSLESFCYETSSRYRWKSLGGNAFATHAGIPGVERIGTNHIQRMWSAFNVFEDRREINDAQWEGFKLTASAMAPTGIKKLDANDKQRKAQEAQRRQTVRDHFFYWAVGLLDSSDPKRARPVIENENIGSKSVEDLEEEMRRWVSGEEDWHDKVIREYKQRVIGRLEAEEAERVRLRTAIQEESLKRGEDLQPSTALVGYTPDQLSTLIGERQSDGPSTVRQVGAGNDRREYLYDKYLKRDPTSGKLRAEGENLVVEEGKKDRLAEEVARRQVRFKGTE
jgi:hypothetical protein